VTDPFSLGYTSSTESEALRAPRRYSMVEYITLGVEFALPSYTLTRQLRGFYSSTYHF
jgi:hypothetical protein